MQRGGNLKKLMIVDGNSIVNRAFYGIRMLTNADGMYTNAIYGFLNILFKYLDGEKPDGLCVAFDLSAPTFRHKQFDAYKGKQKGYAGGAKTADACFKRGFGGNECKNAVA